MKFQDISNFHHISDYIPIFTGAVITDMVVMMLLISGKIQSKTLGQWYHKFGIAGVLADVFSIVIGILIARFLYPILFSTYSVVLLAGLAVCVQVTHDILFYMLFQSIPRGQSSILDVFKDYAKEEGIVVLFADAGMMVSTTIIASILASFSAPINAFLLIFSIYIIIYVLYSIK